MCARAPASQPVCVCASFRENTIFRVVKMKWVVVEKCFVCYSVGSVCVVSVLDVYSLVWVRACKYAHTPLTMKTTTRPTKIHNRILINVYTLHTNTLTHAHGYTLDNGHTSIRKDPNRMKREQAIIIINRTTSNRFEATNDFDDGGAVWWG